MSIPEVDIKYFKHDISTIEGESKPIASSGKKYPLFELTHRDFELLIYSLYKQEIDNKRISYDDISLMSGIRDKGQDCILFDNEIKKGLIQCKHSENNKKLGTKVCVEEIIKFVLYSFIENSLIPDENDFTYFFSSSSGFETSTDTYLRTFSKKINKEAKLETWTKNVIKNSGLIKVTYDEIKDRLIKRLSSLNVRLIVPEDIQNLITFYQSVAAMRFFEVRAVVDISEIKKLGETLDEIKKNTTAKSVSVSQLLREFSDASVFLSNYRSTFSVKNPIKISRSSTTDILTWIKSPLKEKEEPITIVKGGAGSGKSVVLNNLYHLLTADKIPTIGLKADEKNAESITKLEEKLNLSIPLEQAVGVVANFNQKTVIIIDQIDALSQTLSANRDNLSTYILLIEKLKRIQNVRIVISVREYDLNYDPYLFPFKKLTAFGVGVLGELEVKSVLNALGVKKYSPNLLKLLSTPLHLELFCQIYNKRKPNFSIYSLYDLYNELWELKILKNRNREFKSNLIKTLYTIASAIYDRQGSLAIKSLAFENDCVEYLITEGLLIQNERKEVMFFHQTFYDYIFARQFVESKQNVVEYLNANNQGLFVRSSLKIILSHLRDQSPNDYKVLIIELLSSKTIRFHIKQLVLNYIGFIDEPTYEEKSIIEEVVINSKYEGVFIDAINSASWVAHIIELGFLDNYLNHENNEKRNSGFQFILRNLNVARKVLLNYFIALPINDKNDNTISNLLYFLDYWDESSIFLFERIKENSLTQPEHYCHCFEKAINHNSDWVFNQSEQIFLAKAEALSAHKSQLDMHYPEIELVKTMFKHNRFKTFQLCKKVIEMGVEKTEWKHKEGGLSEDGMFHYFSTKDRAGYDTEFIAIYIDQIKEYAVNTDQVFTRLLYEYSKTNFVGLLRVIIYGILANPKSYYHEAFELLKYIHQRTGFILNEKLEYFLRNILGEIYPLLGYKEKEELNEMILSIKGPKEYESFSHTGKKIRTHYSERQRYSFLQMIPLVELKNFPEVHKRYLELNRRFGKIKNEEPNVFTMVGSHPPYSKSNYEKMSLENWEETFLKYNSEYREDFFSGKGGLIEHARAFEEHVSKRPDLFYSLIEKIIQNKKISDEYKTYGISGLIKGKYDAHKILNIITKVVDIALEPGNVLLTIWNIDYLIKNQKMNDKIFDFLSKEAILNEDPKTDELENPLQRSINSVRGAALDRLMQINDKKYENRIFRVLNKSIQFETKYVVRTTIMHYSAYLLNLNPSKAFNIFKKVLSADPRLIKEAMWSGEYFAYKYLNRMDFFFELAIKERKVYKSLSLVLTKLYILNKPKAKSYLYALRDKTKETKSEIIRVVSHPQNLISSNGVLNEKCVELFEYFLDSTNKEVVHQYSISFLHFTPDMFGLLFPILKSYSRSRVFMLSPAYFCKYITQCCSKENVHRCSELLSSFGKLVKTNITKSNYYESEPLNLVLAIYNVLGKSPKDSELKEVCMNMFDKMLSQPQHRNAASKAVELSDL